MSQYSKGQRKQLRERIVELKRKGLKWNDILELMASEGFKSPNGDVLKVEGVYQQYLATKAKKAKRIAHRPIRDSSVFSRDELRIIGSSNLSEALKNRIVRQFL